jgi:hypothetical protein
MAFDLDAARAQRLEATGATRFTFTFGGADYTVDPSSEWPVEAVDALANGLVVQGLQLILGGEQWDLIGAELSLGDAEALIGAIAKHEGLPSAGNSSGRAKPATRPKSKRSSSANTG